MKTLKLKSKEVDMICESLEQIRFDELVFWAGTKLADKKAKAIRNLVKNISQQTGVEYVQSSKLL